MQSHQFIRRCLGALKLDGAAYREISQNPDSVRQSASIVFAIAFLGLATTIVADRDSSAAQIFHRLENRGVPQSISGITGALVLILIVAVGWGVESLVVRALGTRGAHIAEPMSLRAVAAPVGFARLTGVAICLTFFPTFVIIGSLVSTIWGIAAGVVLTRALFSLQTGRALVITIVSAVAAAVPAFLLNVALR